MKVHLLFADRDPDLRGEVPPQSEALVRDLGLETLLATMAAGDRFLWDVAYATVLSPLQEPQTIRYRQDVLRDCLEHPDVVRELYSVAVEAVDPKNRGRRGWFFGDYPYAILQRSIELLERLLVQLRDLRRISDEHGDSFGSDGFRDLFAMLRRDLPDDYFDVVEDHLRRLRFRNGVFMTAWLGETGKGTGYVLRRPRTAKRTWHDLLPSVLLAQAPASAYVYRLPERDEAGARALSELKLPIAAHHPGEPGQRSPAGRDGRAVSGGEDRHRGSGYRTRRGQPRVPGSALAH